MDREIEAETRKKLLNTRFYRPLNRFFQIELAMRDYTTINYTDDSQPSTSTGTITGRSNNFMSF